MCVWTLLSMLESEDHWDVFTSENQNGCNIDKARKYERKKCIGYKPFWVCSYKHCYEGCSYYELTEHINLHLRNGDILKSKDIKNIQIYFKRFYDKYCYQRFHCKGCTFMSLTREQMKEHLLNEQLFYCTFCRVHRKNQDSLYAHEDICERRGYSRRRHFLVLRNRFRLNVYTN